MALLLLDLDDTLIDRAACFRAWAAAFCDRRCLGDAGAWLEAADEGGYAPRREFFARVRERFALADTVDDLVAAYVEQYPRGVEPPSGEVIAHLGELRERGWKVAVVTNGSGPTQRAKLAVTGLDGILDACCISEVEGVRKPDAAIFRLAAERCSGDLAGAWMVGDNPAADIGGAHRLGLRTIWLRHGRAWPEDEFEPTLAVDSLEHALEHLVGLP